MNARAWGEEYRSTTVCIDSYRDGEMTGRFYNRYLENGKAFVSLMQFLIEMEKTLDYMDFPKAYTVTRTFAKPPSGEDTCQTEQELRKGEKATFVIRVVFRQNASWQGTVVWLEGRQEQSFRSVLELLLLMENALNEKAA